MRRPTVTLRDVTERPETLECGSNILSGCGVAEIMLCLRLVLNRDGQWNIPIEYQAATVGNIVAKLMLEYRRI